MGDIFDKLAADRPSIENLADLLERTELANYAKRLREQYQEACDPAVHIVVLGGFNMGKSTFINAMLGAKVLPMSLIPTTAYVTRVGYSPYPEAVLHYVDNARPSRSVNIEELAEYLTIANSQNHPPLREVTVLCPWRLNGQQELVLYDTPGFNDQAVQAQAARAALKRSDLTIFMLDARHPLTETEIEVATGWLEGSFPIFLINFMNLVDEDDHDQIFERVRAGLKSHKLLFPDVPLTRVDVLDGLKGRLNNNPKLVERSGLLKFEETLLDFARGSHREKLLSATRRGRLQSLLGEIYQANKIVLESDTLKKAARETAAQQHREKIQQFARQVEATVSHIEKIKSREIVALEFNLIRDLENVAEAAPIAALQSGLQDTINNHLKEWLYQFEGLANQDWLKLRPAMANGAELLPLKFGQLAQQPVNVTVDYQAPTSHNPPPSSSSFNRDKPLESLGGMAQDMGRQLGGLFSGLSNSLNTPNHAEKIHRQQEARQKAAEALPGLVTRLCANIERGLSVELQNRARALKEKEGQRQPASVTPPPSPQELLHRQIEQRILNLTK